MMDLLMIGCLALSFVLLRFLANWCDRQIER